MAPHTTPSAQVDHATPIRDVLAQCARMKRHGRPTTDIESLVVQVMLDYANEDVTPMALVIPLDASTSTLGRLASQLNPNQVPVFVEGLLGSMANILARMDQELATHPGVVGWAKRSVHHLLSRPYGDVIGRAAARMPLSWTDDGVPFARAKLSLF